MISLIFSVLVFAGTDWWSKDFAQPVPALFFDANSQKIFVAVEKGEETFLEILSKKGDSVGTDATVKGKVKKIFSFGERIFVLTGKELISFDRDLKNRKKELAVAEAVDVVVHGNGDILSAEVDGVYRWRAGGSERISEKKVQQLFFDSFQLMGMEAAGAVWELPAGKLASWRWNGNCASVWKYNTSWLCVRGNGIYQRRETAQSPRDKKNSNKEKLLVSFPSEIHGFAFGYQKEEKDLFWVISFPDGKVKSYPLPQL